ncbi:glycoside hydrolase family 13 protein [Whalleya microplaca]|nr:glycoside hydrolase family 13 protein [Whalleya microplaca]
MRRTACLSALWAIAAHALSPEEWRGQSIYQVLTDRFAKTDGSTDACNDLTSYCGGTWQGLVNKLDYIQGMGFTAIWISPIVKNLEDVTSYGAAYHGYWAEDIEAVNEHYGTEDDLLALSAALHDRGMYLMVDVVTNHMGWNGCGDCVDYSRFNPFNSQDYYHPFCEIDYSSETSVQQCWEGDNTVALPDLKTEDSGVRDTWNTWITDIVAKYTIDGLRIDSLKHVEKDFWPGFQTAANIYMVGEVLDGDPAVYPDWLDYITGVMNYPQYVPHTAHTKPRAITSSDLLTHQPRFYWLTRAFESTSATMTELVEGINTLKGSMNTSTLGTFTENHDQPRFASLTTDTTLAQNLLAFSFLADGIPIVYQGQEQGFSGAADPANREALWTSAYDTTAPLYTWIARLNAIRAAAAANDDAFLGFQAEPLAAGDHAVALRKGSVVAVFSNAGAGASAADVALAADFTGFAANAALVEVVVCTSVTADANGGLTASVGGDTQVFFPEALAEGLC